MELTAKYLSNNPAFLKAANEIEPILEKSLLHFLKLPKEQKKSWHSKLKSIAHDLESGKMQPKDLPKGFSEQFGMDPSNHKSLEQTMKTFVSSLNLKKGEIKLDKNQLEQEVKSALEKINFGKGTLSNITYDMVDLPFEDDFPVFETNQDRIQACKDACWDDFLPQLALALIVFAVFSFVCALFSFLSFGLAAGPCFSAALAIFLVLLASAVAQFDACSDNCELAG